jgi:predicted nucleotidyltransferase
LVAFFTPVEHLATVIGQRLLSDTAALETGLPTTEVDDIRRPIMCHINSRERTDGVRPSDLIDAGRSVLREVAEIRGFTELAVFGSAARGDDEPGSDLDLLVRPPAGADLFDVMRLEQALASIVGRDVNLVSYGGLDPRLDRDILREKVML